MATRKYTNKIIVHCSVTRPNQDIGAAEIDKWHKARGWSGIGYHFVIRQNGAIELGRELDAVGAHTIGQNGNSVSICLVGGLDNRHKPTPDFYTEAQWRSLRFLLDILTHYYTEASIHGHFEFTKKACPCFIPDIWYTQDKLIPVK